jgi:hypothetical protein
VLYTADWCAPCRQAAAALAGHSVAVVERDVGDPTNEGDARDLLEGAGYGRSLSLPTADVAGVVVVGSGQSVIAASVRRASRRMLGLEGAEDGGAMRETIGGVTVDWATSPRCAEAGFIRVGTWPDEHSRRAALAIRQCVTKYPPEVLSPRLDAIHVVSLLFHEVLDDDGLRFEHIDGVTCGRAIVLGTARVHRADSPPRSVDELERICHHELAHVLLKRLPTWAEDAWLEQLPPGFTYGRLAASEKWGREADYANGFASSYARTSLAEDVSELAASLLAGRIPWDVIQANERLGRKAQLVVRMLRQIDPTLTEGYLRTLARWAASRRPS